MTHKIALAIACIILQLVTLILAIETGAQCEKKNKEKEAIGWFGVTLITQAGSWVCIAGLLA